MERLAGHGGRKAGKTGGGGWTCAHVLYMFYTPEAGSARRVRNEFRSALKVFAYALYDTAIGRCAIAWGPRGVIGVQLPERSETATRTRLMRLCPSAEELDPTKPIVRAVADIQALLHGERKNLRTIPLDMSRVPAFNARVYETARAITPGQTRTYGEIARAIGDADGARAVGQALSRNPFAIVVPCHRVVGADFRLVGFSANGGIATKLKLLQIEGWRAKEPMLFEELV
jgi:methylated-DNA-[protein]-cysteine S-methyltransferase